MARPQIAEGTDPFTDQADALFDYLDEQTVAEAARAVAAEAALLDAIGTGGGGAVDSVNGQAGVVDLDANDVGADATGTAAGLVSTEATARAAADTAEATAREAADTAEGTARTAAVTAEADARVAADATLIPLSQKGVANGVAPLDGTNKIPAALLPPFTFGETFTVASQAAMLALAATKGDIAVRSDNSTTFILSGTDPTVLGDWTELLSPGSAVSSVNTRTGAITGLAEQTAVDADLALKAPLASPAFTGTPTGITKSHVGLGNVDNTSNVTERAATATLTNKTLTAPTLTTPTTDSIVVEGKAGTTGLLPMGIVGRASLFPGITGTFELGERLLVSDDDSFDPFDMVCVTAGTVGVGAGPAFVQIGRAVILAAAATATDAAIADIPEIAVDTTMKPLVNVAGVVTVGSANPITVASRQTDDVVAAAAAATPATTNIVPNSDGVLKLAVEVNTLYRFWCYIIYNMTATADLRIAFAKPVNSTIFWTPGGVGSGATTSDATVQKQSVTAGTNARVGGIGAVCVATIDGIFRTGATAGFLEFLAAQWNGEASDGTIVTGSTMTLQKLA